MCRIFYALNQPYLKSKIRHFLTQATNKPPSLDGYGLAAYNPATKKWRVYKTPKSPIDDRTANDFAEYPLVIGHMRNANIVDVPKTFIDGPLSAKYENAHPFYYKNHVFLHNGRFEDAHLPEMRQWFQANILPEYWSNIKGYTDSECLFYLLLSTIKRREWIYKDIDLLGDKGCDAPSKAQELRDAVLECFRLLDTKFHLYIANFIYSDKEYSVVGRLAKNSTIKDRKTKTLWFSNKGNRILFSTEAIEDGILLEWGQIYVIHNITGTYHNVQT
jgi:predicted glutamine amidotransferase